MTLPIAKSSSTGPRHSPAVPLHRPSRPVTETIAPRTWASGSPAKALRNASGSTRPCPSATTVEEAGEGEATGAAVAGTAAPAMASAANATAPVGTVQRAVRERDFVQEFVMVQGSRAPAGGTIRDDPGRPPARP
ncbi:hypothetical protein SLA_4715 [Streptomyces laurentii]|uniref:Uncharacterized protein n=1 Tax=Streptomyces laurentii TaxID=39478 RepID=A0A160P294_STRLU|nr:hypothetical protein SLA_4715 [Streptomyces laurentii]